MRGKTHARRTADIRRREGKGYAYEGAWERLAGPAPRRVALARMGACVAVAVACVVVPGVLPVKGLVGTLNVTLTYAAEAVAVVAVLWTFARLAHAGEPMRAYAREETAGRLPGRALVAAFFAAATTVGDVVRLVAGGSAPDAYEVVFLACGLVATVALGALWRLSSGLVWERTEAPGAEG